ncbi:MAG: alpha/beta hydrolase family protein [Parabacteroides merdae]
MGYPIDASYSTSSNVDNAYRLKGKLLLINGELDDNVDPASTLQVVSALDESKQEFRTALSTRQDAQPRRSV